MANTGALPVEEPLATHLTYRPDGQPLTTHGDRDVATWTPDCYWHLFNDLGLSLPLGKCLGTLNRLASCIPRPRQVGASLGGNDADSHPAHPAAHVVSGSSTIDPTHIPLGAT